MRLYWLWLLVGGVSVAAVWGVCFVARIPVRPTEREFIKNWLGHDPSARSGSVTGYWRPRWFSHVTSNRGVMDARTHELAALGLRPCGEGPLVVLNLDHFGMPWVGGPLARRLRRLVDGVARGQGVPVLPIPFGAWPRIGRSLYEDHVLPLRVIERRGRECVFSKTVGGEPTYYLSGFDRNEFPPLYFLTELPRAVASIRDAREALKPASVVAAEADRRRVFRQGDMFAIATRLTTGEVLELGGKLAAGRDNIFPSVRRSLYGTAHTATYVATLPDGTMLARGKLYHDPMLVGSDRGRDHKPCRLARGRWHVVAKNTTPMGPPPRAARHVPPRRSPETLRLVTQVLDEPMWWWTELYEAITRVG